MSRDYSPDTCRTLVEKFRQAGIHRRLRVDRYEAGDELVYEATGVVPALPVRVKLRIDKFIGGGFAGQVYRANVTAIDAPQGNVPGLRVGGTYAVKILIPPSAFSRTFRDAIYAVGFQGPFSHQVNPAAVRAGALWQKFIQRATAIRFGDDRAVKDVLATFVDRDIGSCGEISEWVEGRNWRFEVDDRLGQRRRWCRGKDVPAELLGSPEYRAKKTFMAEFVRLLHELGAHEFARQYEWWTCKSQPNVFKRLDTESDPEAGLTAMDFRAGLALLPFLPMSPGDVPLIFKGLARGSLVQFDRGDLSKLRRFVDGHREHFSDMGEAMDELAAAEDAYRNSQPDVTHNHMRLLYSRKLWAGIFDAAVTGWQVRNITDEETTRRLRRSRTMTFLFALAGLLPLVGAATAVAALVVGLRTAAPGWPLAGAVAALAVVPGALGRLIRRLWGRADARRHLAALLTSPAYLLRAVRAHAIETAIRWLHAGRIREATAQAIADNPLVFFAHLPLSVLPVFLHKLLTDWRYVVGLVQYIVVRPLRLYFKPAAREQWLRDMVSEGRRKHMLTDEDAERILSRIQEPFIQKYLKSLAVHVCTLPVTQIVSVGVAIWYKVSHGLSWNQAWDEMLLIIGIFQVIPISPGSLARGLYVLYLVIRERNFKDYNIAVFLGFFKYVGYLAFPIQMAYRYPALARFMAAHWATGAVHIVPVFGEHGALLEHAVFDLFYNRPLTIRRRMKERAALRANMPARSWHAVPLTAAAVGVFALANWLCLRTWGTLPTLANLWAVVLLAPVALGAAVTLLAGGTPTVRRIVLAFVGGAMAGIAAAAIHVAVGHAMGTFPETGWLLAWKIASRGLWMAFLLSLLSSVAALVTEISRPDPPPQTA